MKEPALPGPGPADAARLRRRRVMRLVLALLAGGLGLLLAEVGCRLAELRTDARRRARTEVRYTLETVTHSGQLLSDSPGTVRLVLDPTLGFRLAPGHTAPGISTNSLGLRGPELSRQKPPGTFRIVLTGGSVSFGWGASSDAACVAPRLQALLSTPERPVEVINAGCPAYTLTQELLWLTVELLDLQPDLVVSLTGHNDLWDAYSGDALFSHELFRQLEQRLEEGRRLGPALLHASALGRRLEHELAGRRAAEHVPTGIDARREEAERRFAAIARRMALLCEGRLLLAIQPDYLCGDPGLRPVAEREQVEAYLQGYLVDRAGFTRYHHAMRAGQVRALEALPALGARGVDLGDALAGLPEPVFTDLVHLTDYGSAQLAERLAPLVRAHPAWTR